MSRRAVPVVREGDGSEDFPWGINHLITPEGRPGVALDTLPAGDELRLDGGTYDFATDTATDAYDFGVLCPAATDCTIRSKPGEIATLRRISGRGPLIGSYRRGGFIAHRTKWRGLELVEAQTPGVNPPLARIKGTPTNKVEGCEVGWLLIRAGDITGAAAPNNPVDNHECIRLDFARGTWIHHGELTGCLGGWINSAGYKSYGSEGTILEDMYVHGNTCGVFFKDGSFGETVRRCLVIGNLYGGDRRDMQGCIQNGCGNLQVYDNITDGPFRGDSQTIGLSYHHNLLRDAYRLAVHGHDATKVPTIDQNSSYDFTIYNNVLLSPDAAVVLFDSAGSNFAALPAGLSYLDYNLVAVLTGAAPTATYRWADGTRSLAAVQALGHEANSRFIEGGPAAIFSDPATYALKADYLTMGRDGDIVGPRDPATILDLTRYGPAALVALEGGGGELPPPPDPTDTDPPPTARRRAIFRLPGGALGVLYLR